MDKTREKFEELLRLKTIKFKWDGKRYEPPTVQSKWIYFSYGWMLSQEKK